MASAVFADGGNLRFRPPLYPPFSRRQRTRLPAIEVSQEEYYRVLKLCSERWHEGKNEIIPWWNYFLGMLRSAYKKFERQVESVEGRPAKSDLVRQTVLAQR